MHPCVIVINCPISVDTSCKALQDEDWSYLVMSCVQVAATFVFHHVRMIRNQFVNAIIVPASSSF